MSSTLSWPSTTPAPYLKPPSAPGGGPSPLLARGQAATSSKREKTPIQRIQQPRDRVDALRWELDAVADVTEAAKMATRHAERRAREAAAELCGLVVTGTNGMQAEKKLRELGEELGSGT